MEHKNRCDSWNIHFGSVVIGFLLALCLALVVGASRIGSEAGQYQIASGSDDSAYVLDTQTGQVWKVSRSDHIDLGTPFARKSVRKSITPMLD